MKYRVLLTLTCVLSFFLVAAVVPGQTRTSSSLKQFDNQAAQCRRVVRKYCAVVREMMKEKEIDPLKQEKGLALLKDARKQWAAVAERWSADPPAEYASDKSFKARLQDFANALEDMEKALEAGDVRRSFMACSFGCGLFVAMHEQNALFYALDALYHLRKSVKTGGVVSQSRGLERLRPLMFDIMQKRDRVLTAPAPWQKGDNRLAPYYEAVRQLSRNLDEWALAVGANDSEAARAAHKKLLEEINTAYGLAL